MHLATARRRLIARRSAICFYTHITANLGNIRASLRVGPRGVSRQSSTSSTFPSEGSIFSSPWEAETSETSALCAGRATLAVERPLSHSLRP